MSASECCGDGVKRNRSVPRGTERLRFTPSPAHTDGMMDDLVAALDALWTSCNVKRMGGLAA
jgi:5-aminolevulinate synthase